MIDRKIKKVKILFIIICITQLFYLFHYRSGFNYSVFKDPFSQDSGNAYAVSEEVIESNNLLKKNKISKFNLSENLQRDKYFHQRFVEFNYPIRLDNSSKFALSNLTMSLA